jgi:hypothetical protein
MRPVLALILHLAASSTEGSLVRALSDARLAIAERQRDGFMRAGADEARIVAGPPDGLSFGERVAGLLAEAEALGPLGGVVTLGSGSIPLAGIGALRRFVAVAGGPPGLALANNRYSADVVAVSRASDLLALPPLPADNALPRWLEERAGVAVTDLRTNWRLGVDVDTPLDLWMLGPRFVAALPDPSLGGAVRPRVEAVASVLRDRRAEFLVAGRVSAATVQWLERGTNCRIRALVEERGLRAATRLAKSGAVSPGRRPASVLGALLDREGPEALGRIVAGLGDAAAIDTRVLLAHRHGADERRWPSAEDRFASDLLLAGSIADPWLRALTEAAAGAPVPILLGGHSLVNGGLRLTAERAARAAHR